MAAEHLIAVDHRTDNREWEVLNVDASSDLHKLKPWSKHFFLIDAANVRFSNNFAIHSMLVRAVMCTTSGAW